MINYTNIIIEVLILLSGLISVYVGLTQRIARIETEIKWIKQILLNKKEVENG
ncbi:MAG: hypothetical protein QXF76_04010 [Candidatus Anstonellales archaeon]